VGAASDIFIAYDGDESGRLAASRASEVIIAEGGYPFVLPLAEGEDPDSFLLSRGAGAFDELMTGAIDPVSFRISLDPAMRNDARESRRIGMVRKLVEFACQARDPIVREALLKKVSEKTDYSMDSLLEEVRILDAAADSRGTRGATPSPGAASLPAWDRSIMQALLSSPEGLSEPLLDYIEQDDLSNETAQALLEQLKLQAGDGYSSPVLSRLTQDTRACCAELMSGDAGLVEEDRTKIRRRVASARRKRRIAELRAGIGSASPEEKERIVREISALTREGDD
jgi:DNA primase